MPLGLLYTAIISNFATEINTEVMYSELSLQLNLITKFLIR